MRNSITTVKQPTKISHEKKDYPFLHGIVRNNCLRPWRRVRKCETRGIEEVKRVLVLAVVFIMLLRWVSLPRIGKLASSQVP